MNLIPFAICATTAALIGCAQTPPVPTPAHTKEVVKIGQMRPLDDAYWAFCQPDCEPPTPKTRVYAPRPPDAEQITPPAGATSLQPPTPAPGLVNQIR